MTKAHFVVGSFFFALFLLTGAYMLFNFPELYRGREEVRMMYRATHIYLLMSCLINLLLGLYLSKAHFTSFVKLKTLASSLVLVCPLLLLIAFYVESPAYLIERPISFLAVIVLVVGVQSHCALAFWEWLSEKR